MKKRVISLLLVLVLTFSLCMVGCSRKPESVNENVSVKPLYAEGDGELWNNPDRGFRTEFYIMLKKTQGDEPREKRTVYVDESEEQIRRDIQSIFDIYIYSKPLQVRLSLAYIYLTEWRDEELSDNLLRFLDIYFSMCREQKIKNMLRFAYCHSHEDITTGASEHTIVRHVKQLKDVVARNADTIHTIESGFVGSYGEWAEVYQHPPVNYANVIRAITENLAVPNNLFFSVWADVKKHVGKDYEYYWSISSNNDAMYGYHNRGWKPNAEYGTEGWLQVEREGAYTPQGGEMHVNYNLINNNTVPIGFEMIMQCYYWRQTTMSCWHGYLEALGQDNVMSRWMNEEITTEKLSAEGIIYDPNWFLDENGATVQRNCYEFIRDYLGYKICFKNLNLSWSGEAAEKMKIDASLINYGFSAAFNLESGFAILDKDGKVIAETKAGEPSKWYNRAPETAYTDEILTHTVSAEIDHPTEKGEYKLAFYLRNTMGVYANLSNTVENISGYNVLCTFEV